MQYSNSQFKKDAINIRNSFEFDQVRIRYEGKIFDGLLDGKSEETNATLWGLGRVFDCSVRFDVGSLKTPQPGDELEMKRAVDRNYVTYRIVSVDDIVGTSYLISLEAKYV